MLTGGVKCMCGAAEAGVGRRSDGWDANRDRWWWLWSRMTRSGAGGVKWIHSRAIP